MEVKKNRRIETKRVSNKESKNTKKMNFDERNEIQSKKKNKKIKIKNRIKI